MPRGRKPNILDSSLVRLETAPSQSETESPSGAKVAPRLADGLLGPSALLKAGFIPNEQIPNERIPHERIADDILIGARSIAQETGLEVWQVYYAARKGLLPIGRFGKSLAASRKRLRRAAAAFTS